MATQGSNTRALCSAFLACWLGGTGLASPGFCETLPYRAGSHDAMSDGQTESSAYHLRRKQFRGEPMSVGMRQDEPQDSWATQVKIETPVKPQAEPMKITIPNLKALEQARPHVFADAGVDMSAAKAPIAIAAPLPAKPQALEAVISEAKIAWQDDRPRQSVAEFKPVAAMSAQSFAALAPAAGGDAPLIVLPDESSPSEAKAEPVATPPAPTPVPTPAAEPAVVTTQALDQALAAIALEEAKSDAPKELPSLAPKNEPAKSGKKTAKKTAEPEAPPAKAYSPLDSEPELGLSEASKRIAKNIPANLDKPKAKPTENLDIERGRDLSGLFKAEEASEGNVQHESMGLKIDIKSRSLNLEYELEKAYDALVSGQSSLAVDIYKNILENDSDNKDALFGLATTYHRLNQLDQARIYYGKLLAIAPRHRDGLNNFLVLLADEAPTEALTQMEKLAKRNPDFSPIPAQMAVIYQKLGDPQRAADYMFRAIELAPENLVYRYNLAIMLDRQKKYDEAGRLYKQLVEAAMRGEVIPGNLQKIQQRLTFLRSNR